MKNAGENSAELSQLNKMKIQKLPPESDKAKLVRIWEAGKPEITPEGIFYKVTNSPYVTSRSALCILGFNQPLILVSGILDAKERKAAARHEMEEFRGIGHGRIARRESPSVRREILRKATAPAYFWPRRTKH